jgi:RNA polymerase sigma-70 factor, ECF subfamily
VSDAEQPVFVDEVDGEMVRAVVGGDSSAYRALIERYQDRVHAVAYGMVQNREDAQDVTQETFVRVYQRLGSFGGEASFRSWMFRIAMNLALDAIRRRKRAVIGGQRDVLLDRHGTLSIEDPQDLEQDTHRKRVHRRLLQAVEDLPEDQRQIILLRDLEGLSYAEIGAILEIPEAKVMARLHYARKKLVTQLGDAVPEKNI